MIEVEEDEGGGDDKDEDDEKLPARMNVRRPIMPNWSTTMFAGMFVTRPDRGRVRLNKLAAYDLPIE